MVDRSSAIGADHFAWAWPDWEEEDDERFYVQCYRGKSFDFYRTFAGKVNDLVICYEEDEYRLRLLFHLNRRHFPFQAERTLIAFCRHWITVRDSINERWKTVNNNWRVDMGLVEAEDPKEILDAEQEQKCVNMFRQWARFGLFSFFKSHQYLSVLEFISLLVPQ